MPPTPSEIAAMKEAQFQSEIVIPLLRAMKFRGIAAHDGGPLELGKDIVAWRDNELGERENFAVVVKARKISGKATGKGSANEVYFQIKQAIDNPFYDLTSTDEHKVHRCWVVSSKPITTEAINAIQGILAKDNLDRVTRFVGPELLSELMQEFMPERGVFEDLDAIQKKIDALANDEHYRVVATTKKEFVIEPRYPGAEKEKPFLISALFEFDTKNTEGKRSHDDFVRHLKTGAPVEIKAPYFKDFVVPEFLQRLMKPDKEKMTLKIGPARFDRHAPFKFEIICKGSVIATLDYVDLELMHAGTEEATFRNEHQQTPWKITMVIKPPEHKLDINYKMSLQNHNVSQVLQALKFSDGLSCGDELRVVSLEYGFDVLLNLPKLKSEHDPHWIDVFEQLALIQSRTGVQLTLHNMEIKEEDQRNIFTASEIIKTGRATANILRWPVESKQTQAQTALEQYANESVHSVTLHHKEGNFQTILGVDVAFGPVVFFCERTFIPGDEWNRLREAVTSAQANDVIKYSIHVPEGCPVEARFLNWLPSDEAEEIKRLPIFQ